MTQAEKDALLAKIAELRAEILAYLLPRNRIKCDTMLVKCDAAKVMATAITPTP